MRWGVELGLRGEEEMRVGEVVGWWFEAGGRRVALGDG